jgi:hypothetical protein
MARKAMAGLEPFRSIFGKDAEPDGPGASDEGNE